MCEAQYQQVFLAEQPFKRPCTEGVPITFPEADAEGVLTPHKDALFITVMISNFAAWPTQVDNSNSVDIISLGPMNNCALGNPPLYHLCPSCSDLQETGSTRWALSYFH